MAANRYTVWKCGTCDATLGLKYPNGVLAIKYKDLVAWVVGYYRTVCRRCKTVNSHESGVKIEDVIDQFS